MLIQSSVLFQKEFISHWLHLPYVLTWKKLVLLLRLKEVPLANVNSSPASRAKSDAEALILVWITYSMVLNFKICWIMNIRIIPTANEDTTRMRLLENHLRFWYSSRTFTFSTLNWFISQVTAAHSFKKHVVQNLRSHLLLVSLWAAPYPSLSCSC